MAISAESIINNMMDAFALHKIILDNHGMPCDYQFMDINPSFENYTGLKKEQILGKKVTEVIPGIKEEKTNWIKIYGEVALQQKSITFESYADGLGKWFVINAFSPKKGYFITLFHDISSLVLKEKELTQKNEELAASEEELRQQFNEILSQREKLMSYQKKLQHLAYYDEMTDLPNRASLYRVLSNFSDNQWTQKISLHFIDLDNFKYINDTMGHLFGDRLILAVSRKIASMLDSNLQLFRFGGDEFVILQKNFNDIGDVEKYALENIQIFEEPFLIDGIRLYVTASIGISILRPNAAVDELLKYADIAMYQAKKSGKNKYIIYSDEMQQHVQKRMNIEKHLRFALKNNEFNIHYQPQIDLKTGKIYGFEALLRWNNEEIGPISPSEFIPIAEDTQLIVPIGAWVLKNACIFLKQIHNHGFTDISISVNISKIQLFQNEFATKVLETLQLLQLQPKHLEIEITESVLTKNYSSIQFELEKLKNEGVKISLDDFGKGYSSLGELNQLPITSIKIDKSFIDTISMDKYSRSIINMIIRIGRTVGLKVIAEGVEDKEQLNFLAKHKCHRIQGYIFYKPLTQSQALYILRNR